MIDTKDPNSTGGGAGTSHVTADEIINGETGISPSDTSTNQSDSDLPSSDGAIGSITGMTDCATGARVELNMDGNFPVPEGWDDPNVPPVVDGFILGASWQATKYFNLVGIIIRATAQAAAEDYVQAYDDIYGGVNATLTGVNQPDPEGSLTGGANGTFSFTYEVYWNSWTETKTGGGWFEGVPCTPDDANPLCPLTPPTEECWPTDDITQYAIIDGKYETSPYDCDAQESAPTSNMTFCTDGGNQIKIEPATQGGMIMYKVDENGAPAPGVLTVTNADGTIRSYSDVTEVNLNLNRPK